MDLKMDLELRGTLKCIDFIDTQTKANYLFFRVSD